MIVGRLTWSRADDLIARHTEETVSPDFVCDPLVTVVVLTYNHAAYVEQSLDSVVNQETCFPFEIIVGDDCSDDGTSEIVDTFQLRFPGFVRVQHSSQRLGRFTGNGRLNLIRGLKSARGRYLCILEGDDYWTDRRKLQMQFDVLESKPGVGGVFHDTTIEYSGQTQPWFYDPKGRTEFKLADTIDTHPVCHTSSFMFRSSMLPILPDSFLRVLSADMMLISLVASNGDLRRIPKSMSVYRRHDGGVVLSTPWHKGFGGALNRIHLFRQLQKILAGREQARFDAVIRHNELRALNFLQAAELRRQFWMIRESLRWAGWGTTRRLLGTHLIRIAKALMRPIIPRRVRNFLRKDSC